MWLALLLLSSLLSAIEAGKKPHYFLPGLHSLPNWPVVRSSETTILLVLTLVVLLLPKILGAVLAIRDPQLRRQYGGVGRLCAGMLVEQLFSMLLAPSMMLFHSTFVTQTLLGRSVSWHLALGLAWGAIMLRIAPQFFWWLTPVLIGLVCSVCLTAWTSRISAGALLRRWGLLLTPEETEPPPELVTLSRANLEAPEAVELPVPQLGAAESACEMLPAPAAAEENKAPIDAKETSHDAQSWIPGGRRAAAGSHPGVGRLL
jgi:membrane glycosyltransferase